MKSLEEIMNNGTKFTPNLGKKRKQLANKGYRIKQVSKGKWQVNGKNGKPVSDVFDDEEKAIDQAIKKIADEIK